MKNVDIINIINGINSNSGIMQKRLPVKLLFALKRNISSLNTAIGVYRETLDTICGQHNVSVEDLSASSADTELGNEIKTLLNEECGASIIKIPEETLYVESDKYDSLTLSELEALEFMISDGEGND